MRIFSLRNALTSTLLLGAVSVVVSTINSPAFSVEKYQSRLNSLLLHKNDLYLPSRLVLGETAKFTVKAAPGSKVKLFISTSGEGYSLSEGTLLRVGKDAQLVEGTVPSNGVLQLQMEMPKEESLAGQYLYIDAVAGPTDEELKPVDLVDSTGRRTGENTLAIVKPNELGGPNVAPNMPGISPQMFNQLTQMGSMAKDDPRRKLLDNGDIDQTRQFDKNPFINRGAMPGLSPQQ
jgi:hypothetical protein